MTATDKTYDKYRPMFNAPSMGALSILNARNCDLERDFITGCVTYRRDGLSVRFERETSNDNGKSKTVFENDLINSLDANTMKILDILTMYLSKDNTVDSISDDETPLVTLSLSEYLGLCGKKDTKPNRDKARITLGKAFEVFHALRISYRTQTAVASKNAAQRTEITRDTKLCNDKGVIKNNTVYFRFSPEMARRLLGSFVTLIDTRIFTLDVRNPNAYALARKLLTHYGMDANIIRRTNGRLKLETAVKSCPVQPNIGLTKTSDRHRYRRKVEPYIDALDRIREKTGFEYRLERNGTEVTRRDLENGVFGDVYISFSFEGYPDQSDRLKRKYRVKSRSKAEK